MNEHTPVDKNERLIIGYFPDKEQAEHAVDALRHWDTSNAAVKLGNIGIMVQEDGKLKTSVPRKAGKGAALGLGIGAIAGILSGGMTIVGGLLVGGVVGGALGALFKKSLGLSPEDMQKIATHLEGGLAAVVVMCDDYEVDGVVADLKQSGGTVESFDMSSALLPDAEKAVNDAVGVTKSAVEGTAAAAAAAVESGAGAVKQATDATTSAVKQAADATSDVVKTTADVTGDAVKKTADATADTAKRAAGTAQGNEGKSA
jgi:uncharacterized membrane protein